MRALVHGDEINVPNYNSDNISRRTGANDISALNESVLSSERDDMDMHDDDSQIEDDANRSLL